MKIAIHGEYDELINFNHPGGKDILKNCENETDCTALFKSNHNFCNMENIRDIMEKYKIYTDPSMKPIQMFKFKTDGFYKTVTKNVQEIIKNREENKAGIQWYFTTLFMTMMFIIFQYITLCWEWNYWKILSSFMSGASLFSLGFNVLHDASHFAISKSPFINKLLSVTIHSLVLWNHKLWTLHHVIRHHQYTGNVKLDPDVLNQRPMFRKSKEVDPEFYWNIPKKWIIAFYLFFN